ncbi:MAG: putative toxin-antitoxin system toxin component, PIN family [Lachnospiraceae bacterium]|nr:putative toxin-antitoxin system toxin component, PIN family [Lachnospiraceae bacterium]
MENDAVMQNVVIDTNVIVSAFLSSNKDAATVLVLKKLYRNELKIYYSIKVLEEYKDVLNRNKFGFDKKEINRFISFILKNGEKVVPAKSKEEFVDKKDLPFYEIVMDKETQNCKLITGNIKHFPLKTFIMTPAEFIGTFGK